MHVLTNAYTPTSTATTLPIATTAGPPACPKCGIIRKSGFHSCCAGGGAWYKKCGDPGDSQFDHTWNEGIESCEVRANLIESPYGFVQVKWW